MIIAVIIITHRIPRRLRGVRGERGLEQVASVLVRLALPVVSFDMMMIILGPASVVQ